MAEMNVTSMNQNWRELYVAALLETDKSKLPTRIVDAEKQIAARARELFNSGDHNPMEKSALSVATYALVALRSSLNHRSKSAVA